MADYIIKVDPQDLKRASNEFNGNKGDVKKLTSEMIAIVKDTSNAWKGKAAQSYIKKFEDLQADMNKMDKMLEEHVTDLQKMAGVYERAENANAAAASRLDTSVIS